MCSIDMAQLEVDIRHKFMIITPFNLFLKRTLIVSGAAVHQCTPGRRGADRKSSAGIESHCRAEDIIR